MLFTVDLPGLPLPCLCVSFSFLMVFMSICCFTYNLLQLHGFFFPQGAPAMSVTKRDCTMANISWPPSFCTESDTTAQQPVDPLACTTESAPYTTVEPPAPAFAPSSTSRQALRHPIWRSLAKACMASTLKLGRKATNKSSM